MGTKSTASKKTATSKKKAKKPVKKSIPKVSLLQRPEGLKLEEWQKMRFLSECDRRRLLLLMIQIETDHVLIPASNKFDKWPYYTMKAKKMGVKD